LPRAGPSKNRNQALIKFAASVSWSTIGCAAVLYFIARLSDQKGFGDAGASARARRAS
jgi:hypothetical protein